jgi:hypothetical protein
METLDIVNLIETNPITKLSNDYNVKLLTKIKTNFTDMEQQLFLSSFYCYLNYHPTNDFVIDLDDVWKWLGFSLKENAKRMLLKHFTPDIDYQKSARQVGKAVLENYIKQNGGQNKQTIMLNIKTFKLFCLLSDTKKAKEIHGYFIKLEDLLHEVLEEESNELKLQLLQKENIILEIKHTSEKEKQYLLQNTKKEKQKAVEQAIIIQFPVNTECIYFGTIDNTNEVNEKLIKFGHTNDLSTRVIDHHKHYSNFNLVNAFRVQNKVEIENLIKTDVKIKKQIRSIIIKDKNKTEIIAYNETNFTLDKLTKYIKDIIHSKTYSIDNFNNIIKKNEELENENRILEEKNKNLESNVTEKNIKIIELNEKIEFLEKQTKIFDKENQSVYQNVLLPEDEINTKFNDFVNSICIVRPDVEEMSVNIEGRFRLWNKVKPTKEMFHSLKNYLDTRFKPKRINGHHGYIGIKLKTIEYKKKLEKSTVETFIFQVCKFSDNGKILNSTLLKEYQNWKLSVNKELNDNDNDMKEIKEYLNSSDYVLKATVWSKEGSNEGYYGLSLKEIEMKPNYTSSTGKTVYKRESETNELLGTWNTIAKAAETEGISKAKMSRCVKNKIVINDYYYSEK